VTTLITAAKETNLKANVNILVLLNLIVPGNWRCVDI